MQHYVTQQRGTEPPFSGKLLHNRETGIYHCLCCSAPLFYSETKFDAGCGWPSFYQPVSDDAILYLDDFSHNMKRTEIRCHQCGAHLGMYLMMAQHRQDNVIVLILPLWHLAIQKQVKCKGLNSYY